MYTGLAMKTFDLPVGTVAVSPPVSVTPAHGDLAAGVGGYTHHLFTEPDYPRPGLPFERRPIPGELTLFLMGGLAEQTGLFDDSVIALLGLSDVRFTNAAMVGDSLRLHLEVLAKRLTSDGRRGTIDIRWRAMADDGREILTAQTTMLCRAEG